MNNMSCLSVIVSRLVEAMTALEEASRRLHPLAVPALKAGLGEHEEALQKVLKKLPDQAGMALDENTRLVFEHACALILDSIRAFGEGNDLIQIFMSVLRAMRKHCRAQEALFVIRNLFPEIDQYFFEKDMRPHTLPEKSPPAGLIHSGADQDPYARGGYSLFVPESYRADSLWPLVIALHGGYSHGRDYIWTWLREARTRGFILLSPSSIGRTWSIGNIPIDADRLLMHLEDILSCYSIDRDRILLTGMSDGGTFALGFGLSRNCPVRALAPVSCVLPFADLGGAKDRRICWVHGEKDWMFPLGRTVAACRELSSAGADVRLRIVPDLSHTYPREENGSILAWFDPSLGTPGSSR